MNHHMTLLEFAEQQSAWLERTATEYYERLFKKEFDPLLWMDYHTSNDSLRRSLHAAVSAGVPYAMGISPSDLRREIERLRRMVRARL